MLVDMHAIMCFVPTVCGQRIYCTRSVCRYLQPERNRAGRAQQGQPGQLCSGAGVLRRPHVALLRSVRRSRGNRRSMLQVRRANSTEGDRVLHLQYILKYNSYAASSTLNREVPRRLFLGHLEYELFNDHLFNKQRWAMKALACPPM